MDGIARGDDLARDRHELVDLGARHPRVVDRRADLAGVHQLGEQHALGGQAQREVVAQDGRRLAAQLQRDGHQVGGRGGHHRAAGLARAGEQQVVERQLGELDADAAGLVEEAQLLGREVGRHLLDQERGQVARVLAHLDHRAVAGGEHVGQWDQAQVQREVPRHDDAHDAQRLRDHAVAGADEVAQVHRAALRAHPLAQRADDVRDAVHRGKDLGQQRLVHASGGRSRR